MGLLSELEESRTAMAKTIQLEIDTEVKHMIKTFESMINNPDADDSFKICPQGGDFRTFYPGSIHAFGTYLENVTTPIFHMVYFDADGSSVSCGITYEHDNCDCITIDNRTPQTIATDIGLIFTEKTKEMSARDIKVNITFEEVFDYGDVRSHGKTTISKESLFVIKDAVEKHVGEFRPIENYGCVTDWNAILSNSYFYGMEFTIGSPAPLKRKREN